MGFGSRFKAAGSTASFETIQTDKGTSPVAANATDTLTLEGNDVLNDGTHDSDPLVSVTGDSSTDTVTFDVPVLDPSQGFYFYEQFISNSSTAFNYNWSSSVADGGAVFVSENGDTNSHGAVNLATSGGAGRVAFYAGLAVAGQFFAGGGKFHFYTKVEFDALATASIDYIADFGFGDNISSGDHSDGIWFEYDRDTSDNWILAAANNGTVTRTTSSIAVATGPTELAIVVKADGSEATYYVDGTNAGTVTTNLPASGRQMGIIHRIEKVRTVGASSRSATIYYTAVYQEFT